MVGERLLEYLGPRKVEMSLRFRTREGVVEEIGWLDRMLKDASDSSQNSDA